MARFCAYCGKQIDEHTKFCRYCGKELMPVQSQPVHSQPIQRQPSQSQPVQPPQMKGLQVPAPGITKPKRRKSKAPLIAGLLIVAMIVLIIKNPFSQGDPTVNLPSSPQSPASVSDTKSNIETVAIEVHHEPVALSGTESMSLSPMEGVTI